ncbi:MAG: exosortase A [Sphingomonadales bacterium]|nr:exosortase A [Sphingomonadales bacterium]
MPPDASLAPVATATDRSCPAPAWRTGLLRLAACWLLLVAAFWRQWAAMADQWWNISTYTHVLLVPAIVAWLAALRAPELRKLSPVPGWAGLAAFALALAVWLAGAMAGLALVEQAGAVAMLAAAVPAVLGVRVAAGLLFPLAYMAFLVPFGDELVPQLQRLDAWITVGLLRLTGVPVQVEGVFLWTPAGLFEIAEACSGVKFLIAMVAFGTLAAHLCLLSWRRRAAFVAACVVVPILANGVRSWGTVAVAQRIGAARAGGFDHLVYGWIFFAIVIGGTLAAGWRAFDRPPGDRMIDGAAIARDARLARLDRGPRQPALIPAAMAALAIAALAWAAAADRLRAPLPREIALPRVAGWQAVPYRPLAPWQPRAAGANARLIGRYADARGHVVDVFVALYASQGPGRKADGWGEGAFRPDRGWAWQGPAAAPPDARGDRILGPAARERVAQTSYRLAPVTTGSSARLRLAVIADRLVVRARPTVLLVLSAERAPGRPAPEAAIAAFRTAIGPLDRWLDGIAAGAPAGER